MAAAAVVVATTKMMAKKKKKIEAFVRGRSVLCNATATKTGGMTSQ